MQFIWHRDTTTTLKSLETTLGITLESTLGISLDLTDTRGGNELGGGGSGRYAGGSGRGGGGSIAKGSIKAAPVVTKVIEKKGQVSVSMKEGGDDDDDMADMSWYDDLSSIK